MPCGWWAAEHNVKVRREKGMGWLIDKTWLDKVGWQLSTATTAKVDKYALWNLQLWWLGVYHDGYNGDDSNDDDPLPVSGVAKWCGVANCQYAKYLQCMLTRAYRALWGIQGLEL